MYIGKKQIRQLQDQVWQLQVLQPQFGPGVASFIQKNPCSSGMWMEIVKRTMMSCTDSNWNKINLWKTNLTKFLLSFSNFPNFMNWSIIPISTQQLYLLHTYRELPSKVCWIFFISPLVNVICITHCVIHSMARANLNKNEKKSWLLLLLPQHHSTYPRGPESATIKIPLLGVLKGSFAFLQHFKFVKWRIREFVVSIFFGFTNRLMVHLS